MQGLCGPRVQVLRLPPRGVSDVRCLYTHGDRRRGVPRTRVIHLMPVTEAWKYGS